MSSLAPPSSDSHHQRRPSFTYELNLKNGNGDSNLRKSSSDDSFNDLPLSMRFIHKPSRSQELFIKASDPTKANSILNSQIASVGSNITHNVSSDAIASSSSPSNANSPKSVPLEIDTTTPGYKLVRKKSGELLKPSLKSPIGPGYFDKKRSLSLPATPTYKQVHFGGATDVRYFKKKDKPTDISASNSPTLDGSSRPPRYSDDESEEYNSYEEEDDFEESAMENDQEYHNFSLSDKGMTKYPGGKPERQVDWQLKLLNFLPLSYLRKIEADTTVFLEKLFMSSDKKYLLGHIAVKNISFQKYLTVRYSLDHWSTIIEIPTEYMAERPEVLKLNDYDRFSFKIPLNSLFNSFRISKDNIDSSDEDFQARSTTSVQEKTYEMCIKYYANSAEYWDNNNYKNYEIKLIKTVREISPSGGTGQIEQHATKPKYSNSYLKRVVSDSQLELHKNEIVNRLQDEEEARRKEEEEDDDEEEEDEEEGESGVRKSKGMFINDNSSDLNDFVKNNYYLSSPLLSSLYKNPTDNEEYLKNSEDAKIISPSPQPSIPTSKFRTKFQNQMSENKIDQSEVNKSLGFNWVDNENTDDTSPCTTKPQGTSPLSRTRFMNSKSYKELLDNYCFFSSSDPDHSPDSEFPTNTNGNDKSPSSSSGNSFTVSSFLGT
ncbi:hypothetical protein JA1_004346 [Spathaspora sp. JA1]|nr:hypothetical protein JA1_004346 [Spathaspora sp. JA1]